MKFKKSIYSGFSKVLVVAAVAFVGVSLFGNSHAATVPPSGTISCTAGVSKITVAVKWAGASTAATVNKYVGTSASHIKTFYGASGTQTFDDTNVTTANKYVYKVLINNVVYNTSGSCTPTAPPPPATTTPPTTTTPPPATTTPPTTTTPPPATEPTAPAPADTVSPDPAPTASDNSTITPTTSSDNSVPLTDNSPTSEPDTAVATNMAVDPGNSDTPNDTSTSASDNSTNASSGPSYTKLKSTSKKGNGLVIALSSIVLLLLLGGLGLFFLLRRRQGPTEVPENYTTFYDTPTVPAASIPQPVAQSYDLPQTPPYAPPIVGEPTQLPASPLAQNAFDEKINAAFYPNRNPTVPLSDASPGAVRDPNEPLDMFEMAQQNPNSFGSPNFKSAVSQPPAGPLVQPLAPLEPFQPLEQLQSSEPQPSLTPTIAEPAETHEPKETTISLR